MSIRDIVRQTRQVQQEYIEPISKIQNFLVEAKGLDIEEISKIRGGVPRASIITNVIDKKIKVQTTKGDTTIDWLSPEIKAAFDTGDYQSAFKEMGKYKNVFVTPNGDELKLNNILKTELFGGGRGSGGGAENTATTECAQCVYSAAIHYVTGKMDIDEYLDDALLGEAGQYVDIDVPMSTIAEKLTDDWIQSSILIGNALRKQLGSGSWKFHRGSQLVNTINSTFNKLNKAETPKPFSNVNKWTPADIWAVKGSESFNFDQFSTLGEFNNELKELYDKKRLVGISLKKAVGKAKLEEFNTKGFIRRPVKFQSYKLYARDVFKSKDVYINFGGMTMQLRSFDIGKSWQGEIKGSKASAGKIGGGVLEGILQKQTGVKFKYTESQLKALATKPTPQFLQELYELYLALETRKPIEQTLFIKQSQRAKMDWRYSKYKSMFYTAQIVKNRAAGNKICDAIAGYALSSSDLSAPYIKAS